MKWWLATPVLLLAAAAMHAQTADNRPFDLDSYWRSPLAAQGEPPAQWSPTEGSLAPTDCGQCHREVFSQWQGSQHARAFSAGLVAQLLDMDATSGAECLQCHAPLAEQRQAFETARAGGLAHRAEARGLAAAGNSCGGCHLRGHRHFGPPQRGTGAIGPSTLPAPHGGVIRSANFEQAEFCSSCHQFTDDTAVNGKPLQNTYVEWRASPQAAQGMVCQTCHMPDRAHIWRGIHDPGMVAGGLTPRITADADKVRFELTNSGVGHAFPTYTVPTVTMNAVALGPDGAQLPDTARAHVIARRMHYDGNEWHEVTDTRLLPGQSAVVELPWNGSDRIRVWLEVVPDDYYAMQVFPELIRTLPPQSEAHDLAVQAGAAAGASRFRLYQTELHRP